MSTFDRLLCQWGRGVGGPRRPLSPPPTQDHQSVNRYIANINEYMKLRFENRGCRLFPPENHFRVYKPTTNKTHTKQILVRFIGRRGFIIFHCRSGVYLYLQLSATVTFSFTTFCQHSSPPLHGTVAAHLSQIPSLPDHDYPAITMEVVASIIAVVQIADRIITMCKAYIEGVRDAPADLRHSYD
jgi:hypothetical protein